MLQNVVEKKCCRKILQKNNVDLSKKGECWGNMSKDKRCCKIMENVVGLQEMMSDYDEQGRMMQNDVG